MRICQGLHLQNSHWYLEYLDLVRPINLFACTLISWAVHWILECSGILLISSPKAETKPRVFQSGNDRAISFPEWGSWEGSGRRFPPLSQDHHQEWAPLSAPSAQSLWQAVGRLLKGLWETRARKPPGSSVLTQWMESFCEGHLQTDGGIPANPHY